MSTFDAGKIEAELVLRREQFTRDLEAAKADADKFSGKGVEIPLKVTGTAAANKALDGTQAKADKLGKSAPVVKAKADTSAADKPLDATQARADKLGKSSPSIAVTVSNDSANRQIDDTQVKADRLGKTRASVTVSANGAQNAGSAMVSLIAGAVAVAPAFVVAGAGVAAFAALAVPSVTKVIKAQTDLASGAKGAQAEYQALSQGQQGAVTSLTALEGSYKHLSAAVQPQALEVFNAALSVANKLLPPLVPLAQEGGTALAGLVRTIGGVATDPDARQFAHFLGQEIPQDMAAIGGLVGPVVHLFEGLVTEINPLAVTTIHLASGLVSVADALSRNVPFLDEAAVGALALYKPFKAVQELDIAGKYAGIAKAVTGVTDAALAAKGVAAVEAATAAGMDAEAVSAAGAAVAMDGLTVSETAAAIAAGALDAVNPLAWVAGGIAAVGALGYLLVKTSGDQTDLVAALAKTDHATGSNIAGYRKLSEQLSSSTGQYIAYKQSLSDTTPFERAHDGVSTINDDLAKVSVAQKAAQTSAANLETGYGTLQSTLGLTRDQAITLVAATGKTKQGAIDLGNALAAGGTKAAAAENQIENFAAANRGATGSLGLLTTDMTNFGDATKPVAQRIDALDDAYNRLVGGFVGQQQAFLTVTSGLDTLKSNAKAAGASMTGTNAASVTLQQSFYGQAGAIEKAAEAMLQNGASTKDVTDYIKDQTGNLSVYAGKSGAARDAIKDLNKWEGSLTGTLQQQASFLSTTLTNDLDAATLKYHGVGTALQNYADALVQFPPKSAQVKAAQDQLNKSYVAGGLAANETTNQIAAMIAKTEKIPLKKAIQIVLDAEGKFTVVQGEVSTNTKTGISTSAKTGEQTFNGYSYASGGLITGGIPHRDSVPILAMPGEVVVPTPMVQAGAVDHLRGRLPGFAAGGLVGGSYKGTAPGLGQFAATEVSATATAATKSLEATLSAAVRAAKSAADAAASAASAAGGGGSPGHITSGVAQWAPDILKVLSMLGLPASDLGIVESQMATESEGNQAAINLQDSNAKAGTPSKGLMQVIQPTFERYRSPSLSANIYDPLANIYAGLNYAVHAYPDWTAVLGHGHGYANGTASAAPGWALTGERGRELVQMHGGERVLSHGETERVLKHQSIPPQGWAKDVAGLRTRIGAIGTSLGIRGLDKADAARLKAERARDQAELQYAVTQLSFLRKERGQITGGTEPKLRKEIAALTTLGKGGKLSGSEARLLATLQRSLAGQQTRVSGIDAAINGTPPKKPVVPPVSAATLAGYAKGAPKEGYQKDVDGLKARLGIVSASLGIKGLSKSDLASLKAEQVRDKAELAAAEKRLAALRAAGGQLTSVAEPGLQRQIAALTSLGKTQKLSASETRTLTSLKSSLAGDQAEAGRINTAIYGTAAPKAASSSSGSDGSGSGSDGSSSGDSGSSGGSSGSTTPPGRFVGTLPLAPGLAGGDITGGGTGGLGGNGSTILGTGGFSSGVNASGYQITPSAGPGSAGYGGGYRQPPAFDTSKMEALLGDLIRVSRAGPRASGQSFGAALNGASRTAAIGAAYGSAPQIF